MRFFAEALFPAASRSARRRRAAAFAAELGLRFHAEGPPPDPDTSDRLASLEMLGLRFTRPVADAFWGSFEGRHAIGFENAVWDKRGRRHVPYRFTAVRLIRAAPDLLVAAPKEAAMTEQWFRSDGRRLPVPKRSGRTAASADPAFASGVLQALSQAGLEPLERSWTVREDWVFGWRRGRLRTGREGQRLRFLLAAAEAVERG